MFHILFKYIELCIYPLIYVSFKKGIFFMVITFWGMFYDNFYYYLFNITTMIYPNLFLCSALFQAGWLLLGRTCDTSLTHHDKNSWYVTYVFNNIIWCLFSMDDIIDNSYKYSFHISNYHDITIYVHLVWTLNVQHCHQDDTRDPYKSLQ